MFAVINHVPTDDINCPGISMGPVARTPELAIAAWKESELQAYELSGARDPQWTDDEPDSPEDTILGLARDLEQGLGKSLPVYAFADDQQAYLVEVPPMPVLIKPLPLAA